MCMYAFIYICLRICMWACVYVGVCICMNILGEVIEDRRPQEWGMKGVGVGRNSRTVRLFMYVVLTNKHVCIVCM
jgi:hypothetical protein